MTMVVWRTLIAFELGIGVVAGLLFVAGYWSSPWGRSPAGRHMMAVAAVMCVEMCGLLAFAVGVPVPLWVFVVGYAVVDAVVIHRLLLLYRVRRAARLEAKAKSARAEPGYGQELA